MKNQLLNLLGVIAGTLIILVFVAQIVLVFSPAARLPKYILWYAGLQPKIPPCESGIVVYQGSGSECF